MPPIQLRHSKRSAGKVDIMKINDAGLTFLEALTKRSKTDTLILHHAEASHASVTDIHAWHQARGWSGIGYHYYVRKDGSIWHGRPEDTVGAHAGSTNGYNSHSIGICFEGDYMREIMPDAQLAAGRALIADVEGRYQGKLNILKHGDVTSTDCPGKLFPMEALKHYEEDEDMVKPIRLEIDGKEYTVDAIEKDGANYVKLRAFEQAGYEISFDAAKKLPAILAPDTRAVEVFGSDAATRLQARAGLAPETVAYLLRYAYGEELVRKLAEMK